MGFVLGLVVGVVVGWLVPQPQWAKNLFDSVKAMVTKKAE